jgi:hypothetical protein
MRRLVFPTLKALPFAVGVGMWIYGPFGSDMDWYLWGHLWFLTGMVNLNWFGMRRLLTDWPMGEVWGSGFEAGKKHKRRRGTTLRSLPPPDEQLPAERTPGRYRR